MKKGKSTQFTIREFLLAFLYEHPSTPESLYHAFRVLKEKGLIVLGGQEALRRSLKEMIALGLVRAENGSYYIPSKALAEDVRVVVERKAKVVRQLICGERKQE